MKEIDVELLTPSLRKDISAECSDNKIRRVRSMEGKLGYIGVAVSPLASFAASYIQQLITMLSIAELKHANGIARDVLKRESQLLYLRPNPMK